MRKFFWKLKLRFNVWRAHRRGKKLLKNLNFMGGPIASGEYLDNLGNTWGYSRLSDESDNDYRARLLGVIERVGRR